MHVANLKKSYLKINIKIILSFLSLNAHCHSNMGISWTLEWNESHRRSGKVSGSSWEVSAVGGHGRLVRGYGRSAWGDVRSSLWQYSVWGDWHDATLVLLRPLLRLTSSNRQFSPKIRTKWHPTCCGNPLILTPNLLHWGNPRILSSELLWESTNLWIQPPPYCGNLSILSTKLLWESINSDQKPTVGIHHFWPPSYCGNPSILSTNLI